MARMFEPWTKVLLEAVDPLPGEAVLDVATGAGTVARAAARRVGRNGRVTGTDISPHLLAMARRKAAEPNAAPIEYVASPAAPLAVAHGVFDVVTCQQGVQFFPDRLAALKEMRRALLPGGRAVVAVWAGIERSPVHAALHAALRDSVPVDLADLLLVPWSMPDPAELQRLLVAAKFPTVTVTTRSLPLVLEGGIEQATRALAGTPLQTGLAALPDEGRAALAAAARTRLAPLVHRDGTIRGVMTSHIAVCSLARWARRSRF